jgi:type IV secretory pathway protease TraF
MAPALRPGDHLLVARRRTVEPGRVVVVRLPNRRAQDRRLPDDCPPGHRLAVKRLIRSMDDGALWVEGDNPFGSTDSRSLGPLPPDALVGVAIARLWPRPRVLKRAAGADRAISD